MKTSKAGFHGFVGAALVWAIWCGAYFLSKGVLEWPTSGDIALSLAIIAYGNMIVRD